MERDTMSDFLIRHYEPKKDLVPLSKLLTEIEALDQDGEHTSEEALRTALKWPNYRPSQDVWVADLDGQLVGYAVSLEQPSQRSTVYAVVHPAHRRKGLGTQFLNLITARAGQLDSKNMLIYANERNAGSIQFLSRHHIQRVGSSGVMKSAGMMDIPAVEFPSGFVLKPYSEINEPRILLEALNICYLDMWGHQHNEHPSEEELKSPRFLQYYDAEDILLLFDAQNSIVGIISLKSEARKSNDGSFNDLIDAPGVIKSYREQRLQDQLILAGIKHLRQKGIRPLILEFWGEDEHVLNMYRELGFEMTNHYLAFNKELGV
jgi:mycothiol synthase